MSTNTDNQRRIAMFLAHTIDLAEDELAAAVELLQERFPQHMADIDDRIANPPAPRPRPVRKPCGPAPEVLEAWEAEAPRLEREIASWDFAVPQTDEPEATFFAVVEPDGTVYGFGPTPEAAVRAFADPMICQLRDPELGAGAYGAPPESVAEVLALPEGAALLQLRGPATHMQAFDRVL